MPEEVGFIKGSEEGGERADVKVAITRGKRPSNGDRISIEDLNKPEE